MSKDKEIPKEGQELASEFTKKTEDPIENKATEVAGDFLINKGDIPTNTEIISDYNAYYDRGTGMREEFRDRRNNANESRMDIIDNEEKDFLNGLAEKAKLFLDSNEEKDPEVIKKAKDIIETAEKYKTNFEEKKKVKNKEIKISNPEQITMEDVSEWIKELKDCQEKGSSLDLESYKGKFAFRRMFADLKGVYDNVKTDTNVRKFIREEIGKIKKVDDLTQNEIKSIESRGVEQSQSRINSIKRAREDVNKVIDDFLEDFTESFKKYDI